MTVRFIEGAGGGNSSGPSTGGGRRGRGNIFQRAGRAIRARLSRRGRSA